MIHDRDVPMLRSVDASFDADLEAIVARATERRSSDRIASAARLAEYLQLYLDGKPLPIRVPGLSEMVWRYVRQHRSTVMGSAAAALVIFTTAVVAFILIAISRDEALSAKKSAEAAFGREQVQRQKAEESFHAARATVDEYMTRISQEKLLNVPGLQPLRKELLEKALNYYRSFITTHADDPRLLGDLAAAHFHMAHITADIASKTDAIEAYRQSIALRERVLARAKVLSAPIRSERQLQQSRQSARRCGTDGASDGRVSAGAANAPGAGR